MQSDIISSRDIVEDKAIFTTYHSSKGIESKVVVVVDADRVENRKLLYVGIHKGLLID